MGTAPAPEVVPAPLTLLAAKPLEKASVILPRMWVGGMLATICLLGDVSRWMHARHLSALVTAGPMAFLLGRIYWLFSAYRIHKVLAQATHCSYPVTPRRAFWLQLIPIFNWIWAVKWPNCIARFLKQTNPDLRIAVRWPGIVVLLGTIIPALGTIIPVRGIGLLMLFGVGVYLNQKIRSLVGFIKPDGAARKEHFGLAVTAGLGAGFGLVLCRAIQEFSSKAAGQQLEELLVIILVSLGALKFIEPLSEWVRHAFHAEEHRPALVAGRPWPLRGAIFLALIFNSFSHELLDRVIEHDMWDAVRALTGMLVISGGITYAWVAGAKRKPAPACRSGLLSGATLAMILPLALFLAFEGEPVQAQENQESIVSSQVLRGTLPIPWLQPSGGGKTVGALLLLWAILGLTGGLVIDRNWGGGSSRTIAASILLLTLVAVVVLRNTHLVNGEELALGTSSILGWCLSLVACPAADKVLGANRLHFVADFRTARFK